MYIGQAVHRTTVPQRVAIKILIDTNYWDRPYSEILILTRLRHFNILSIIGAGQLYGALYIVSELMDANMNTVWNAHKMAKVPMSFGKKRMILQQILRGIAYIHKMGIVHGDLDWRNIFVYRLPGKSYIDYVIIKVGDVGLSEATDIDPINPYKGVRGRKGVAERRVKRTRRLATMFRKRMLFSIAKNRRVHFRKNVYPTDKWRSRDMWMFGKLMGEILLGEIRKGPTKNIRKEIMRRKDIHIQLRYIVSSLLIKNPQTIPSAEMLLTHPYFQPNITSPFKRFVGQWPQPRINLPESEEEGEVSVGPPTMAAREEESVGEWEEEDASYVPDPSDPDV